MREFPQIQLEVVWILTNLATGTSQQLDVLIQSGVLPIFIEMLHNNH
jgi:importin subunit alpha-1